MLDISIRQLESFVATVEYSSFTKAAQAMHLTQSTVSMHIQALEDLLGIRLIQRGARKRFTLTEEGKQVYAAAKDILNRCEALQKQHAAQISEQLMLGSSTVPAQYILPELLSRYMKKHPKTRYVLKKGDSGYIHTLLEKKQIRIGFVGEMHDSHRYQYCPIARDSLVLVSESSPRFKKALAAGKRGMDLLDEPMIQREDSSGTQHAVYSFMRRKGVDPASLRIIASMDNPEAIKQSVIRGLGVAVLSSLTVEEELQGGKLIAFPLDEEEVKRDIYMVWRKEDTLTAAELRFTQFVKGEAEGV